MTNLISIRKRLADIGLCATLDGGKLTLESSNYDDYITVVFSKEGVLIRYKKYMDTEDEILLSWLEVEQLKNMETL